MSDNTLKLDGNNFQTEILDHKGTAVVDFWADWCGPCRAIAPTIDAIATETKGRSKVGKVNVDANADLAQRFEVQSIPTLVFFRDGVPVDRIIGVVSKEVVEKKLEALAA